jgi:hypothetical protein
MPDVWSGETQNAARFLIDNVTNVDVETLAALADALVISPAKMNGRINTQLGELLSRLPDSAVPLVIYPGNGANQLSGALSALVGIQSFGVRAKRDWQRGRDPVCEAESFDLPIDVTHCLIVDDVISSGVTMCAVRALVPVTIECWAVAQVSQRLGKRHQKTLSGFARAIVGAELCKDNAAYVPINSISTLQTNGQLAQDYAESNVSIENRHNFLKLLS